MTAKVIIVLLIILLITGIGFAVYNAPLKKYLSGTESGYDNPRACTTEAKICPDGSSVGRTGPDCEFAACPNGTTSSGPLSPNDPDPSEPASSGERITISGTMICLPHKNTNGPQTLECAMGMKADNGKNYALADPKWKFLIGIGTSEKITVTGTLKPPTSDKYDTVGTIELQTLTKE